MPLSLVACQRASQPHVVLVMIDTLRADRMAVYGYQRPTTPHIDALASESVVFDRAIATCPATAPSVASMLTGVHRASHGVRNNKSVLDASVTTLAELLKARGYTTAAVVSNSAIGHPEGGFDQGFDEFSFPDSIDRPLPGGERVLGGAAVVREAERILDRGQEAPLFLWLHLMDPHGPYYPPDEYQALFPPEDYLQPGEQELPVSPTNYGLGNIPRYQFFGEGRHAAAFHARYDAEIRYADAHVGATIRLLRERGLWDNSIFILVADHGESLGEHDYYFQHGWYVYDPSVRVPLVIRAPARLPTGRRVAQTISLVDLTPTVLDLLGLPVDEDLEGRSLLPVIRGDEGDRFVYVQNYYGNRLTALRKGGLKYILTPPPAEEGRHRTDGWTEYWPTRMREELYDLDGDPYETRNLVGVRREAAEDFRRRVRVWLANQKQKSRDRPERLLIDRALEDQLRALGYLE